MLTIQYEDMLQPYLQRVIQEKPQWLASSLKSAAYWSQQEIKKGIRSGAPGGQAYARLMPPWIRRKVETAMGHTGRWSAKPLQRLANATGYDKSRASEGIVTVGWLSQSAVRVGTLQEQGFFRNVTERMRNAFAMAGFPLAAGKTQIVVPARPTYRPMKPIIQVGAPQRAEMKLIQYLQGNTSRSAASSKRVYRVYT